MNLLQNGIWGCLGLFLLWLANRRPIEAFTWSHWRVWGLHLLASIAVAAMGLFLAYVVSLLVQSADWVEPLTMAMLVKGLPRFYRAYFHTNLLFMWAVVAAFHGLRIYRKYKAREVEAVGANQIPPTLLITAYDKHALKAFEVHALDYLLKPFSPERFQHALDRARRWCSQKSVEQGPNLVAVLAGFRKEKPWVDRLLVRQGDRHILVRTAVLQWVEAEDHYVRLHIEGTSHLLRQTMTGLLARLDPAQFRRIHRSAIVNLDCIKEIQPWTGGDHLVVMRDGTRLTLSRTFREQFGEWL